MISIGPILFGFILGLIIGAWQIGEFPFYDYVPLSTGFVSALIGILLSKFIFARSS